MNKIYFSTLKKSFLIGTLIIIFSSCDDYLDKYPTDQISSSTFWNNTKEVEMALGGVYTQLFSTSFNYQQTYWEMLSGDARDFDGPYNELVKGHLYSTSGPLVPSIFSDCYRGIAAANFFLANVENVSSITDETKNRCKGEALFLRALFYFTLTEFYGGVPLYTGPVTIEEAKVQQSTKAEVVAQILEDLEFAVDNLPNTAYSGHAVKGSALALKAKVLLHNDQWGLAANAADQIIQDGKFSLYQGFFPDMFLSSGQADNPEIIFSAQYVVPDVYSQQDIWLLWLGKLEVRQELVDAFECIDGLPIDASPLYDPTDWKKNRDPRLEYSVYRYSSNVTSSQGATVFSAPLAPSNTGWNSYKHCDFDGFPYGWGSRSGQDWVLFRYAEVLLMYAEAKNEAAGPDESVYAAVNELRNRVNMPLLPANLNKEQMRERIHQERRVELALEGKRYLDMKRWKKIETYLPTVVEPDGSHLVFDPSKNYVFPFPQSEIDNNPNLVQNPGY